MKKQIHLLGGALVLMALLAMNSTAFADFVIKGGATVSIKSGSTLTSETKVSVETGATLDNSGTVTLKGDFNYESASSLGTGTYVFAGNDAVNPQTISGASPGLIEFNHLNINNTGAGLSLAYDISVINSVALNSGIVTLGGNDVTLGESVGPITVVSGYFETNGSGVLRKYYTAGGSIDPLNFSYRIGSGGVLAHAEVDLGECDFGGDAYVEVRTINQKDPHNQSTDNYLNRYWEFNFNDISGLTYSAICQSDPSDYVGTVTDMLAGQYDLDNNEWILYGAPVPVSGKYDFLIPASNDAFSTVTGVGFKYLAGLKVFLQGAYDAVNDNMRADMVMMKDSLDQYIFPKTAAEAYANLGYTGPEAVASVFDVPANVVDWVLVQLRDASGASAATSGTIKQTIAGFVLQDGSIVSVDGESGLQFTSDISINPYFVIIHRNHIRAMSALDGLTKTNSTYIYDFTSAGQSYGANSMAEVEAGVFGLFAGETNTSNIITNADKQAVDDNIDASYHIGDVNLSGIVTNEDKQFVDNNIDNWGKVPK